MVNIRCPYSCESSGRSTSQGAEMGTEAALRSVSQSVSPSWNRERKCENERKRGGGRARERHDTEEAASRMGYNPDIHCHYRLRRGSTGGYRPFLPFRPPSAAQKSPSVDARRVCHFQGVEDCAGGGGDGEEEGEAAGAAASTAARGPGQACPEVPAAPPRARARALVRLRNLTQ
eukprot:2675192-Rhodomonas_salina.1